VKISFFVLRLLLLPFFSRDSEKDTKTLVKKSFFSRSFTKKKAAHNNKQSNNSISTMRLNFLKKKNCYDLFNPLLKEADKIRKHHSK
jgi:hypothetical protein